jgi:hypothetical protein
MIRFKIIGNRKSGIEFAVPQILSKTPADAVIDIGVTVSSGAWVGSEIETWIDRRYLIRFLNELKMLIEKTGSAARLNTDKATSSTDFENLDAEPLYINIVSSAKNSEVWIYGHVQQPDFRSKLNFSFEVEHEELKPILASLQKIEI